MLAAALYLLCIGLWLTYPATVLLARPASRVPVRPSAGPRVSDAAADTPPIRLAR